MYKIKNKGMDINTINELTRYIAAYTGSKYVDADAWVRAMMAAIEHAISEGRSIDVRGHFHAIQCVRTPRKCRNPATDEIYVAPAKRYVSLKITNTIQEAVGRLPLPDDINDLGTNG